MSPAPKALAVHVPRDFAAEPAESRPATCSAASLRSDPFGLRVRVEVTSPQGSIFCGAEELQA
jgi:hypothetical protein